MFQLEHSAPMFQPEHSAQRSSRNIKPFSHSPKQIRPQVTPVTRNGGLIPQVFPRPADDPSSRSRISSGGPTKMSHSFVASMQRRASSLLTFTILLPLLSLHLVARTQPPMPPLVQAKDRITTFIDDDQRVTLRGNVHPLALLSTTRAQSLLDFPWSTCSSRCCPTPRSRTL